MVEGRPLLEPGAPWVFNLLDDDTDSWGQIGPRERTLLLIERTAAEEFRIDESVGLAAPGGVQTVLRRVPTVLMVEPHTRRDRELVGECEDILHEQTGRARPDLCCDRPFNGFDRVCMWV